MRRRRIPAAILAAVLFLAGIWPAIAMPASLVVTQSSAQVVGPFATAIWNFDFYHRQYKVNGASIINPNLYLKENVNFVGGEYEDPDGIVRTVAANALQISGNGLEVWPDRTFWSLQSNDLTNAVWTKTNATVAKDQVGKTGVANSASSMLATADGATISQAVTISSRQHITAPYLKRLVGTGTVKLSLDGCSTFTDVTAALATAGTAWTHFGQIISAVQTLANPTLCLQLGTNGDKIAVDRFSVEFGNQTFDPVITFPSPPMQTAGATVNRPHNRASTNTATNQSIISQVQAGYAFYQKLSSAIPGSGALIIASDGSSMIVGLGVDGHVSVSSTNSPTGQFAYTTGYPAIQNKVAGYTTQPGATRSAVNALSVNAATTTAVSPGLTHFDLDTNGGGGNGSDIQGPVQHFVLFANPPTNAALTTMTASP